MRARSPIWGLIRAVCGAFLGVRKRVDYQQDVQSFKPHHFIIAGIIGAVIFVLTLILFVKWVVL